MSPRKQASPLPDCLCILLPSQGDMCRLWEAKTRTAVMGRSRLCPGVLRTGQGGEPPASHLVGLQ